MIQSGGFLAEATGIMTGLANSVNFPFKVLELNSKELVIIDSRKNQNIEKNYLRDAGLNIIGKKIKQKFGSGITLTNNEIKEITRSL